MERRKRVREILTSLGFWDQLRAPAFRPFRDQLMQCYYPRVKVSLASDVPVSEETKEILSESDKALYRAEFNCPLMGQGFPAVEFFSFIKPLMDVLHAAVTDGEKLSSFLQAAREKTSELASPETAAKAILALFHSLEEVLIKFGRIDRCLYYLTEESSRTKNQEWLVRLVIHRMDAQTRTVKVEQGPRPAYRCGQPYGPGGIDWVEWHSSILGLEGDQTYPVYVQSHALDNLYRREARALFIKDREWLLHEHLWCSLKWCSLKRTKLIPLPRAPGKFLVEYRLNVHKLGYLVARPLNDLVLIESFLFLTMDGTPEGDALWNNLRLRRDDKKYLKLDRIQTFLMTDVQHDSELVSILEKCGCGHLFKMLKEPLEHLVPGYAEEWRKYLRLDR